MLLWLIACTPAAIQEEPEVAVVLPAAWRFSSDAERVRYEGTRSAIAAWFVGVAHAEPARVGNFLRESWGEAGDGATLAVLHVPARYPEVFGLVLDVAGRAGDVATAVHWSRDGGTITGDVLLLRTETPAGRLELSTHLGYTVGPDTLSVDPVRPELLLADLRASPESFQARGEALLGEMATRVAAHLDGGGARRCEYGPPPGDGRPPECALVPLSSAELEAERARLDAWTATGTRVLAQHGPTLHAQVVAWLPESLIAP